MEDKEFQNTEIPMFISVLLLTADLEQSLAKFFGTYHLSSIPLQS